MRKMNKHAAKRIQHRALDNDPDKSDEGTVPGS